MYSIAHFAVDNIMKEHQSVYCYDLLSDVFTTKSGCDSDMLLPCPSLVQCCGMLFTLVRGLVLPVLHKRSYCYCRYY